MRESIGSVFLYNLIIIFIVLIFAFLAATLSYYKAFKVNNRIISIIEKYEGFNNAAITKISETLTTIGYTKTTITCPKKDGGQLQEHGKVFLYCVYFFDDGDSKYYSYGVITYIYFDVPFFNTFLRIPIYTKSDRIYRFS